MVFASIGIPVDKLTKNGFSTYVQYREIDKLWEFPGGKVEVDEEPEAALVREFEEEVQVKLEEKDYKLFKIYELENKMLYVYWGKMGSKYSWGKEVKLKFKDLDLENKITTFPINYQIIKEFCDYLAVSYSYLLEKDL